MDHPFIIRTHNRSARPGTTPIYATIDEARTDTLDEALSCARQLVEDAGDSNIAIAEITITLAPGHRLVRGEPMYSADWLR